LNARLDHGSADDRPDIDGLRALSVALVLLFHAGVGDVSGGFIGVDVFFVISGYLIIPQMVRDKSAAAFSLGNFYARRIRRLVPALIPVLIYALLVSAAFLGQRAFRDFLASFAGASAYVSNYVFLAQSNYFDRASETKALLHTWSLAVEFQFYLLVPLAILIPKSVRAIGWVLALIGTLSFCLSAYFTAQGSDWPFYATLPRLWELAAGGFLGILEQSGKMKFPATGLLRSVGLLGILYCASTFDSDIAFPGLAAVPPVIAALLAILAPTVSFDPIRRALASRPIVWLGRRSYGIYLWHWPLFVTLVLATEQPSDLMYAMAILTSVVLAAVSYAMLEVPIRKGAKWRGLKRLLPLALTPPAVAVLLLFAVSQDVTEGLRSGLPFAGYRALATLVDGEREAYFTTIHTAPDDAGPIGKGHQCSYDVSATSDGKLDCLISSGFERPVLVIGDSQGRDLFHALRIGFPNTNFVLLHESGCPPIEYEVRPARKCFIGLNSLIPQILQVLDPSAIILASHWPSNSFEPLVDMLSRLNHRGTKVVVVGPGPVFRSSIVSILRGRFNSVAEFGWRGRIPVTELSADIFQIGSKLSEISARQGAIYLERASQFCNGDGCLALVPPRDASLMFWDNQHLTISGLEWYGNSLRSVEWLAELLRQPN
jgi:peptidoglycan/LPS O-acetylase OafA/YrhL